MSAEQPRETESTFLDWRELDSRTFDNGRGKATLQWNESNNELRVIVLDRSTGETLLIKVKNGENPLDVLAHPYAVAAHHQQMEEHRKMSLARQAEFGVAEEVSIVPVAENFSAQRKE